jgi:transcriptional regulatory protein LevR
MPQNPSTREAKTKRHNTPPEEAPGSKRVLTICSTGDGSEAKDMDIHEAVGDQKGNDMIETKDMQKTDTEKQERVDCTQDLGLEKNEGY